MKRLLGAGADANYVDDDALRPGHKHAHSPLMQAVSAGSLAKVNLLIEAGANVSTSARNGNTALVQAAESGHHDVAAALLEAGATSRGPTNVILRTALSQRVPVSCPD